MCLKIIVDLFSLNLLESFIHIQLLRQGHVFVLVSLEPLSWMSHASIYRTTFRGKLYLFCCDNDVLS